MRPNYLIRRKAATSKITADVIAPPEPAKRLRASHIFERDVDDWYVEPRWCSERFFQVETFNRDNLLLDPCTGSGRIADAAKPAGYTVVTADIVDRGYPGCRVQDFLRRQSVPPSVVTNPTFNIVEGVVALKLGALKVAIITPVATLNAAAWAFAAPLRRIWLLTPRPSMPPGHLILGGMRAGGGRPDYCWLVFESGYRGKAETDRLHRDGVSS